MKRLLFFMGVKWGLIYALGKYLQRMVKEDQTAKRG